MRIAAAKYPNGFSPIEAAAPTGPWMYTGGLENRSALIRALARRRLLWGADSPALRKARSPRFLFELYQSAALPCPRMFDRPVDLPSEAKWLFKPTAGAGGVGIRYVDGRRPAPLPRKGFVQEFIDGESYSAVFLGDARTATLLGITRQLVAESWLHAGAFRYCGSVGPFRPSRRTREALVRLGEVTAGGCGLRGLFGIDFVLRDDTPWPVEVNPRYTASVEVLEYATGLRALTLHRDEFLGNEFVTPPRATRPAAAVVGKAVLFARQTLTFPAEGAWDRDLRDAPVDQLPAFADIPAAGEPIAAARPILTYFAQAATLAACIGELTQMAADLDRWLFRA